MGIKCGNCGIVLEQNSKICFGSTWYHEFKCPTCNTTEYRVASNLD